MRLHSVLHKRAAPKPNCMILEVLLPPSVLFYFKLIVPQKIVGGGPTIIAFDAMSNVGVGGYTSPVEVSLPSCFTGSKVRTHTAKVIFHFEIKKSNSPS